MDEARDRFLHSAARRYAVSSPALSASLLAQTSSTTIHLDTEHILPKSSLRVCSSCATLQIPGHNSHIVMKNQTRCPATRKSKRPQTTQLYSHCNVCGRHTLYTIDKVQMARPSVSTRPAIDTTNVTSASAPVGTVSATASRQKLRKQRNKATLQSLLAKAGPDSSKNTPFFTLTDLMRKP